MEATQRQQTGPVRWFDNKKGYGFIDSDQARDVFVHDRSILADGYKTLAEGQQVDFLLVESDKGYQAAEVVPS